VRAVLLKLAKLECDGQLAEEVRKAIGYFEANQQRMRYRLFPKLGLFVGSGVVEAGLQDDRSSAPQAVRYALDRPRRRVRNLAALLQPE
jgi:hypothetical protein